MSARTRVSRPRIGRTKFTPSEVKRFIDLVDTSGIVALVEPHLPSGGRPRVLSLRALCVAVWLLSVCGEPTYLKRLAPLLNDLPPSSKFALGLRGKTITTRQVEVLFGHMAKTMDASPYFGGRKADAETRTERDERLQMFSDLLLAVTFPNDEEYTASGDLAFDATIVRAHSRTEATRKRKAIRAAVAKARAAGESDAIADLVLVDEALAKALGVPTWGEDPEGHAAAVRTAKLHSRRATDPDATTLVYRGKLLHSYAVHLAVDISTKDATKARLAREADEERAKAEGRLPTAPVPDPIPMIIRRLQVTASTAAPGKTGSQLLTSLPTSPVGKRNGWAPGDVIADRGYSNAKPENWHYPLRRAGFTLIHDLHKVRQGHTGSHDGVVFIDGQAYSPGILDYPDLVSVTVPFWGAAESVMTAWHATCELRRPFLLPIHERKDGGATIRVTCPALRSKLGCPIRGTTPLVISKGVPEVFTGPSAPLPPICTAKTVTVPGERLAHDQDHDLLFGTEDWYDAFQRRRPRVEGHNGIIKNPSGPHLGDMRIRLRGRAKFTVFVAFIAASCNILNVDAWREQLTIYRVLDEEAAVARRSRKPAGGVPAPRSRKRRPKPARAPAA